MRKIKFRAWDEQKKIMHYDFEFIRSGIEGNDWIIFKSDKQRLEDGKVFDNPYFQQQLKIMQYTGLEDKNGKEIYEGDILQRDEIFMGWDDEEIENLYPLKPFLAKWSTSYKAGWDVWGYPYTVIGNIYENPELLEEQK